MLRRSLHLLMLMIMLFTLPAVVFAQFQPQYDPQKNLGNPGQDEDFLKNAMDHSSAAIEWSKIAAHKTSNPEVKQIADETVQAEIPIAEWLVAEAKSLKVKIPNGLSGKEKKESDKLNGMSGADFDKEYLTALVKVQHGEVDDFREEMKESRDNSMQAYATKTVDTLAARNEKAHKLLKDMGGK